jgi:hypothetical protein
VVAGPGEMGTQRLADRAARSRDHDLHRSRSIGAALPLSLAPLPAAVGDGSLGSGH